MPLDPAVLRELLALEYESGPGLVADLAKMFAVQAPRLVGEINSACARGDYQALEEGAHLLKSTAANLGATDFASLARDFERDGREKKIRPDVERRLQELEQAMKTACDEVRRLIHAGRRP